MKKSFVFMVVMVIIAGNNANAQHPRYGTKIRFADSVRFFVSGYTGFDSWNLSAIQSVQPPGDYYDAAYRYSDLKPFTNLGLNSEFARILDEVDSTGNFDSHSAPDSMLLYNNSDSEETKMGVFFVEPTNLDDLITNSYSIRYEMERHPPHSLEQEYAGFKYHSGLTGRNVIDPQATSPAWLAGTADASDADSNAVQVQSGINIPGVIVDSFFDTLFLISNGTDNGDARSEWWHPCDRKMDCRFRVRVDSLSSSDTISKLFANRDTLFTITIRQDSFCCMRDTVVGTDTFPIWDTAHFTIAVAAVLANTSQFHHTKTGYDTVDVHWQSIPNPHATYFSVSWPGKCSLTFDYMEAMTDTFTGNASLPIPYSLQLNYNYNNWQFSQYRSYNGLTMNTDQALQQIAGAYVHKFDSLIQFLYLPEERQLGDMKIIKRFTKLVRDSSHGHIECIMSMHDSVAQNYLDLAGHNNPLNFYGVGLPMQYAYYTEGVHDGWLDSSLYADPRMFATGIGLNSYAVPLAVRKPPCWSGSVYNWEQNHIWTYGEAGEFPEAHYAPSSYRDTVQSWIRTTLRTLRTAKDECIRTSEPGFRHKYFTFWEGGVTPDMYKDSTGAEYLTSSLRGATAPELKLTANLAVSCGASGLFLYTPGSGTPNYLDTVHFGYPGVDGGVMRSSDGFHGSNYDSIRVFTAYHASTKLDSDWVGWQEDYDSVQTLLPLMQQYGTTLANCRYVADYLGSECYSSTPAAALPFLLNSVRAIDDSDREDDTSSIPLTNRTFAHVSIWVDTTATTDTFLYITNTRTDDSYDSVLPPHADSADSLGVPGTFDRRYITMKMKAPHFVTDVADVDSLREMGKVRTPYVGIGDSLVVWLLPGDGVLVKLSPAPDSMQQMRVQLNYPKPDTTPLLQNFYNHGKIKFSQYVTGVNPGDSTIPSSLYSYVGIKNSQAPTLHQDSILFQKFDVSRTEKWRQQNWTNVAGIHFGFKNSLPTVSGITLRPSQTGVDSIAYHFTAQTNLEGFWEFGNLKFQDPFFVDSNYNNQSGFTNKTSPFFLSDTILGTPYASDPQHYGGVFHNQNRSLGSLVPGYTIHAYEKLAYATIAGSDTLPNYGDWSFLGWWRTDSVLGTHADSAQWIPYCTTRETPIVILKDSANYVARYKSHNTSFPSTITNDTGLSFNNQRKLVFIGPDSLGGRWYRIVYSSAGRIYTAVGKGGAWNPPFAETWINWLPESLVSDWDTAKAAFPALAMHRFGTDTIFTYIYQQMIDTTTGAYGIIHAYLDSMGRFVSQRVDSTGNATASSTPVIARVDAPVTGSPEITGDVAAWTEPNGIHLRGLGIYSGPPGIGLATGQVTISSPEKIYLDPAQSAQNPTIWAGDSSSSHDSTYTILLHGIPTPTNVSESWTPFWIAWQQKHHTPVPLGRPIGVDSVWDILAQKLVLNQIAYDGVVVSEAIDTIGTEPVDTLSETVWPQSFDNMRPCLSGMNSSDTCMVMVAYEANGFNFAGSNYQGVSVAKTLSPGFSWQRSAHFQVSNANDRYLQPSIQVTKFIHDTVRTDYYFSLGFQLDGDFIYHFAMNDSTRRYEDTSYPDAHCAQLSVETDGQDSSMQCGMLSLTGIVGNGRTGTFKIAIDHATMSEYRQVSERDDSDNISVVQGMGELDVDNGVTVTPLDLIDRPDSVGIDSAHPGSWHMRTENFTLPTTGSFYWTPWLSTSCDSLYFENHHAPVHCYLDFYDTTGAWIVRLDSLSIDDSDRSIGPAIRKVTLDNSSAIPGYVVMNRTSGALTDSGAEVQDIITMKTISSANKKADGEGLTTNGDSIPILTDPNPFSDYTTIAFALPRAGPVTISIMDMLGHRVANLSQLVDLHAGEHDLEWHPNNLPSGVYTIVLTFGNTISSARVVYMK